MTQIEESLASALRAAVEIIDKHVPQDALGTNEDGGGDGWNTRSWPIKEEYLHNMREVLTEYDRTRSDTREQAAASPSAVGEVTDDVRRKLIAAVHFADTSFAGTSSKAWVDECFLPKLAEYGLTISALSSQAPKPASAGGEWVHLLRADIARELTCSCDADETCFRCLVLRKLDSAIAAEADTAKVCAECGGVDRYHVTTCSKSLLIETPAADRLAPSEARGVVTDAETHAACIEYDHANGRPVRSGLGDPKRMRAALEAFLRARESAPAVETPPNSA